MRDVSIFKSDHQCAELWQAKPLRHLPLEYTTLSFARPHTFARYDQHQSRSTRARGAHETQQRGVGFALRQPMQIETTINCFGPPCNALLHPAAEWRQRRE